MVVDTSALLAIMFDEPECEGFVRILSREPSPMMGAPTVLEASIVTADRVGTNGLSRLRRTMRTLSRADIERAA